MLCSCSHIYIPCTCSHIYMLCSCSHIYIPCTCSHSTLIVHLSNYNLMANTRCKHYSKPGVTKNSTRIETKQMYYLCSVTSNTPGSRFGCWLHPLLVLIMLEVSIKYLTFQAFAQYEMRFVVLN